MLNDEHKLNTLKVYAIGTIFVLMCLSFLLFTIPGYTALYWAWIMRNYERALPYIPMARTFGMLAVLSSSLAFGVLCSPRTFPLSTRARLSLSIVATCNLGSFGELRNEGKFWLKEAIHFFGPGTWARAEIDSISLWLGAVLYTIEYSHWNDFLMGPVIVSVLFGFVFWRIRSAALNPTTSFSLTGARSEGAELEQALRFGRIIMYVALFWFFSQALSEEAGLFRNPHLPDVIDMVAEICGTAVGFWMARFLTRPFDNRRERFWSTMLTDFMASGPVGLGYTLIVGVMTEGIERATAYALFPKVAPMFEHSSMTSLQLKLRPIELLVLAIVVCWAFNKTVARDDDVSSDNTKSLAIDFDKRAIGTVIKGLAVAVACLAFWGSFIALFRVNGIDWPVMGAAIPIAFGLGTFLFSRRNKLITLPLNGRD